MSDPIKIVDTGDGRFKIVNGISEFINSDRLTGKIDFSRISLYGGDKGIHTGSDSPSKGRGGKDFGSSD